MKDKNVAIHATAPSVVNANNRTYPYGNLTGNITVTLPSSSVAYSSGPAFGPARTQISNGSLEWNTDDNIVLNFVCTENNQSVNLHFSPESNITVPEWIKISLLLATRTMNIEPLSADGLMRYVRNNNLERHFKISLK